MDTTFDLVGPSGMIASLKTDKITLTCTANANGLPIPDWIIEPDIEDKDLECVRYVICNFYIKKKLCVLEIQCFVVFMELL